MLLKVYRIFKYFSLHFIFHVFCHQILSLSSPFPNSLSDKKKRAVLGVYLIAYLIVESIWWNLCCFLKTKRISRGLNLNRSWISVGLEVEQFLGCLCPSLWVVTFPFQLLGVLDCVFQFGYFYEHFGLKVIVCCVYLQIWQNH